MPSDHSFGKKGAAERKGTCDQERAYTGKRNIDIHSKCVKRTTIIKLQSARGKRRKHLTGDKTLYDPEETILTIRKNQKAKD